MWQCPCATGRHVPMARSRIASAVIEPICPWEGATDLLRELAYQDSVTETAFSTLWWRRLQRAHNRHFAMAENLLEERDRHPFDDGYWASKRPALERIEVPALSCASWSDHGLHTRGSLEGFERIGSARKCCTRMAAASGIRSTHRRRGNCNAGFLAIFSNARQTDSNRRRASGWRFADRSMSGTFARNRTGQSHR
jgi:hypothetical protein